MANKSLTDLTVRTATADSDLLHINSGGTDYKETKGDFLRGNFYKEFSGTTSIKTQAEALPLNSTTFGTISAYGHQTESEMPSNGDFYVRIQRTGSANYISIEAWNLYDPEADHYILAKRAGTWLSWKQIPARSEITSLNNSLTQCLTKTAGYIDSGNLNNYVTNGLYLMADKNYITNCPSSWSALLVIGIGGSYGCHQLTFAFGHGIYYRSLTGSPLAWTTWKHLAGE